MEENTNTEVSETTETVEDIDTLKARLAAMEEERTSLLTEKTTLKTHNDNLLNEKKQAQQAAEAAKLAEMRASGDLTELENTLTKQHADTVKELNAQLHTLTITNVLKDALRVAHDHAAGPLTAYFMSQDIAIKDGVANIGGKPLTTFVSEYFASDEGKHFVKAPANSGGSSSGSSGATATGWTKETFTFGEFTKMALVDKAKANSQAAQLGLPFKAD